MEQERVDFPARTVHTVAYQGPAYRVRPLIKWALILLWIVYFGLVVAILRGDTLWGGVKACAVPTLVGLLFLYRTRSRTVPAVMEASFLFYPDYLLLAYENSPVTDRYDRHYFRQVYYWVKYADITKICYQRAYCRLEIYGTISVRITARVDGKLAQHPDLERTRAGAAMNAYLPPERAEEIMAAVCRNSGRPLDSIEQYGRK